MCGLASSLPAQGWVPTPRAIECGVSEPLVGQEGWGARSWAALLLDHVFSTEVPWLPYSVLPFLQSPSHVCLAQPRFAVFTLRAFCDLCRAFLPVSSQKNNLSATGAKQQQLCLS